jgi:hypothetical protein
MGASTSLQDLLEPWSGAVFLAAGGVWLIDSALYVLDLFGGVSIPGTVNGTLILTAFLLTQVGILGLYTPLTDETPRLAATGGLFVGITGLVTAVTLAWMLAAGFLNQPIPPGSLLVGLVLGSLVALLLFGLASVSADAPSRTAGVLLLLLAAAWSVWILTGLLITTPEWSPIAFGVTFSVVTSATGYVLHAGITPTDEKTRSHTPATR